MALALIIGSIGFSSADESSDTTGESAPALPSDSRHAVPRLTEIYLPDVVFFESAQPPGPSAFKRRLAEKRGEILAPAEPQTLLGRLYLPEGPGPFAAVVLLHGSGGIWEWDDMWAERLRAWGYVVLDVDSLTPRGLYRHHTGIGISTSGRARRLIGGFVRSLDAQGARAYLATRGFVDPGRIAAMGMSQGGQAAMYAVAGNENPDRSGAFRAAVALYPQCDQFAAFEAPLIVLIGTADEWVSARRCEANLGAMPKDHELLLKIYEGAHHVFDFEAPERRVHARLLRYDAAAAQDAESSIQAFLSKHLR